MGDNLENTVLNMKGAMELYFEDTIENDIAVPQPQGLEYYIKEGIFNEGEIAEDYFITHVEIKLPAAV